MNTDPRVEAAARQVAVENGYPADYFPNDMADISATKYRELAARILAAADKAATITTVEGLDALPAGSRVALADTILFRTAEVVDETVWRDLSNASPFDLDEIRMLLTHGWKARVIHWGTE